jgi:hypothetical protein
MGADIRDYIKYENPDPEGEVSLALYAAAARSFAINMTDKTFLKGVNNLFNVLRDPEYYGEIEILSTTEKNYLRI